MNPLIIDVETTISNNGNCFDTTNRLVLLGLKEVTSSEVNHSYHTLEPSLSNKTKVQNLVDKSKYLVLFNAKFDLHWLRSYGIKFAHKRIWDCQIGEYIKENQLNPFPSLDDCLASYGLPLKQDKVKEYWKNGVDTFDIPTDILIDYLKQDLLSTERLFRKQVDYFKASRQKYNLFCLLNEDLLVLEEIESNGIYFDTEAALRKSAEVTEEIEACKAFLSSFVDVPSFNWNSRDHLSCLLYGGDIVESIRVPVGVYKSGAKEGQTRYKIMEVVHNMPQLITPVKGSERDKAGYYSVAEDVLKKLKPPAKYKPLLVTLNKLSTLEKLNGSFLIGYTELIKNMNWPDDMIHGNFNMCRAITGRLSSDKPNLQNADPITKLFMYSRYGDRNDNGR